MALNNNTPQDISILFECTADKKVLSFVRNIFVDISIDPKWELIDTDSALIGRIDAITKSYYAQSLSQKNINRSSAGLQIDGQYGLHQKNFYDPEKEAGNNEINEKRFINYNNGIKSYFNVNLIDFKDVILARMAEYQLDNSLDVTYIRGYIISLISDKIDEITTPEEKETINTYVQLKDDNRFLVELARVLNDTINPYDSNDRLSLTKIYNCVKKGLIDIRFVAKGEALDINYPKSASIAGIALSDFLTKTINRNTRERLTEQGLTASQIFIESEKVSKLLKNAFSNWKYDANEPATDLMDYINNQTILTSDSYDVVIDFLQAGATLNGNGSLGAQLLAINGILSGWRGSVVLPSNEFLKELA